MWTEIIQEAPLGQLIRWLSKNQMLQYPEERPGFELPADYSTQLNSNKPHQHPAHDSQQLEDDKPTDSGESATPENDSSGQSTTSTADPDIEGLAAKRTKSRDETMAYTQDRLEVEQQLNLERTKSVAIVPKRTSDGIVLVDWYTNDDPANPYNWPVARRHWTTFVMCFYTWVMYAASSMYAASEEGVMERFGVSHTKAVLPLSMYIIAYGMGPLLFGPLSEIPTIGRNPVYWIPFVLFFILSFPTAVVDNFAGLVVLRFLQGFMGSPAISNAGATFGDVYSTMYVTYPLSWWVWSAWAGPAFGPLMSGFAVMNKNWRWSLWEIVWMAVPVLILLVVAMPETSARTILLRRAQRLRKLTGDSRLQSQSEIDQRHLTFSGIVVDALVKPTEIVLKDPAVFFVNLYTALFYGIYYTFFEVFPLVFPPMYGFNLGETGLAFVSCQIGATIGLVSYFIYVRWWQIPYIQKNGISNHEYFMLPAMVGSFFLPIGLFIFAWTSRPDIHWIVPLIGVTIFVAGTMYVFQSVFLYIPLSYPKYAASLFAGNDISRASMAAGSVLYARPMFINLGIGKGVSTLGGLSVMGIIGTFLIYWFGAGLRARSKFADK
ncbi:major facilitator superfamily domain-containing protein [Xylogone sp. PMI_703]|nr:major facilitator superfamily domain-containing protein [Xylogone sp. PMI_703]